MEYRRIDDVEWSCGFVLWEEKRPDGSWYDPVNKYILIGIYPWSARDGCRGGTSFYVPLSQLRAIVLPGEHLEK